MSFPKNRITREVAKKSVFEDLNAGAGMSSAVNYNQGDLLYRDASSGLVSTLSAETDAATFLGIAEQTVVSGVPQGPYQGLASSAHTAIGATKGPAYGVIAKLIAKSGDAFAWGVNVYADPASGDCNVQVAGTKPIGVYQGPNITGDGVKEIEVLLGARYPNDVLKF